MNLVVVLLAVVGCALSLYAYCIEQKVSVDKPYRPICDISDLVSCTKTFKSSYSRMFGVSNSLLGIVFYSFMIVCALLNIASLLFMGALAGLGVSILLAYIVYVKIKAYCIVCTALYIINILLFIMSI
jgi:uncharacterized membrane protein